MTCVYMSAANVQLGVLFISHHIFSFSPLCMLNCCVHSYSAGKIPFVVECTLSYFNLDTVTQMKEDNCRNQLECRI